MPNSIIYSNIGSPQPSGVGISPDSERDGQGTAKELNTFLLKVSVTSIIHCQGGGNWYRVRLELPTRQRMALPSRLGSK